jgi:hypothetical protein
MKMNAQLQKLRELEKQCRRIRARLGVLRAGEVIFQAAQARWSDNDIVVEADGIGGAKLLVAEGNLSG